MIVDRETNPIDDLGAVWMGHGVELAARVDALRQDYAARGGHAELRAVAEDLRDVLACEYNPLTRERHPLPDVLREPR